MLKRYQVMLEEWQGKYIQRTFKKASFSMGLRLLICAYILAKKNHYHLGLNPENYDDLNFAARKEANNG